MQRSRGASGSSSRCVIHAPMSGRSSIGANVTVRDVVRARSAHPHSCAGIRTRRLGSSVARISRRWPTVIGAGVESERAPGGNRVPPYSETPVPPARGLPPIHTAGAAGSSWAIRTR
jgi:hypothetical protein